MVQHSWKLSSNWQHFVHPKLFKPGAFLPLELQESFAQPWLPTSRVCRWPSPPNPQKTEKKYKDILTWDKRDSACLGGTFLITREEFVPVSEGWNQPCFWPSDFSNNIHLSQAVAWPQGWFLLTPDGFHLTRHFCSAIITLPVVNELNCHSPHFPTNYSELWTTLEWENLPYSSWC